MSRSRVSMTITGAVSAGSKDANGREYGGIYFPAHEKNGRKIAARFEVTIFANLGTLNNKENNRTYRIVAWNSNNATPGRGLADIMAKTISFGKTFHPVIDDVRNVDKRLFINGEPAIGPDGNVITYPTHSFRLDGVPILGPDSAKTVANEIANWDGSTFSFTSRPPQWNVPGTTDAALWQQICNARKNLVYDGKSPEYGFCRVIVPDNARVLTPEEVAAGINNNAGGTTGATGATGVSIGTAAGGTTGATGVSIGTAAGGTGTQVGIGTAPTEAAAGMMTDECPI